VGLGWTGLHLPEVFGGAGGGLLELLVILVECGRAVAPGPLLATALTSAVIAACGNAAQHREWLPGLAEGSLIGATALGGSLIRSEEGRLHGSAGLVLSAETANILLLVVGDDLVLVDPQSEGVVLEPRNNLDPTQRVAFVRCEGVRPSESATLVGALPVARTFGRILASAEACGGALACLDMAVSYAKLREQFDRAIGSFQAIKHHCANMLITTDLAVAAVWDAACATDKDGQFELAGAVAAALTFPAFDYCAKLNIQIHGGIGYTWEHDAHLYLRRAAALSAIFGPVERAKEQVARLHSQGVRRKYSLALPPECEQYRERARIFAARHAQLPKEEQRAFLVAEGYLMPSWPHPWGRGASAAEQLAIEQELEGIKRPELGIGEWVAPVLMSHGTAEQVDRWVRATMLGELVWCQLFSEPGAGSDAAAITTRGTRVDGGWHINGQKVWTSAAQECNRGLATVRTDSFVSKRKGISVMVIDMHAAGVEIRPLRDITGEALFNEVFFSDVFVPDSDVVGQVNDGWRVARSTLGNERVSIGSDRYSYGPDLVGMLAHIDDEDSGDWREVGALLAEYQAMHLIHLRQAATAITGVESQGGGLVSKLLNSEHAQKVTDLCMRLIEDRASILEGESSTISQAHLFVRCLTIGGGTSEILRNQIAEQFLGLPRGTA